MSRRKLSKLIEQAVNAQPVNKAFLTDLMSAIEMRDLKYRRKPSQYYKPSSFVCLRQMYFMRVGEEPDNFRTEYTAIGMADTGTRRHEAIQEVLLEMDEMGYDWKYVDVEEYLKEKWAEQKCLTVKVKGKKGAETKLFDEALQISFMCDGIIQRKSTGQYYLFEFKNQVSFKYATKVSTYNSTKDELGNYTEHSKIDGPHVDADHIAQVSCYCMALDLDQAFVVYENRDVCTLECPEVLTVTEEMKSACSSKIFECDSYVEKMIPPPPHDTNKPCRWCSYQTACRKAGK